MTERERKYKNEIEDERQTEEDWKDKEITVERQWAFFSVNWRTH